MNKIKSALTTEVARLIQKNFPIVKNRTPLWFFADELNKQHESKSNSGLDSSAHRDNNQTSNNRSSNKLGRKQILERWNSMEPESKRKYFNMAEFDEVRYKEQKYMWIAQMGSLLIKRGNQLDKLPESLTDQKRLQDEFLVSLEKYHKNYEQMIQAESTRMLYKDVIKRAERTHTNLSTDELISAVPDDYRPVLSRPRRPASAFILYAGDNMQRLSKLRREEKLTISILKLAAQEWLSLTKDKKSIYEERYIRLMDEYIKASEQFKAENMDTDDNYLGRASKEKKAFKKSLRKRLRDSAVLPVNVRNAFNFFLMDNKEVNLTKLTEIWRNLPEAEKANYKKLNEQDASRYRIEKLAYETLIKDLERIIDESRKEKPDDSIK